MKLELLMSCMRQSDFSLVEESHITGDVLVINQADENSTAEEQRGAQKIRMITVSERGLSCSRNMAIQNSVGDICLLCDDDEVFVKDYEKLILTAFEKNPHADVIAFNIENKITRLGKKQRLGYLGCLKIASYQIAFRRDSIIKNGLYFDPFMGAGSGNGGSEENKFLWDCLKKGLRVYYMPITIASLEEKSSTWFFGYDRTFFYQRGAATRYMMGTVLSVFYGIYYVIRKRALYKKNINMMQAANALFQGILENPIEKQKKERSEV